MSQANHASSTTMPPVPTRRVFLCNTLIAATIAAAGGGDLAAQPLATPSPLFQQYLRAREALLHAYTTWDVRQETATGQDLQAIVDNALSSAVRAIKARRPSSLRDMVELAQVAVNEMETDWARDPGHTYDFEEALARGLLALAEGGAHG